MARPEEEEFEDDDEDLDDDEDVEEEDEEDDDEKDDAFEETVEQFSLGLAETMRGEAFSGITSRYEVRSKKRLGIFGGKLLYTILARTFTTENGLPKNPEIIVIPRKHAYAKRKRFITYFGEQQHALFQRRINLVLQKE